MNLLELYDQLVQFEENPTQTGISILRGNISLSVLRGEITDEEKEDLFKQLYTIATEAGLFVLQLKNIEFKEPEFNEEEGGEDEDSYEESYEESYSYEEEEEEEEDDKV